MLLNMAAHRAHQKRWTLPSRFHAAWTLHIAAAYHCLNRRNRRQRNRRHSSIRTQFPCTLQTVAIMDTQFAVWTTKSCGTPGPTYRGSPRRRVEYRVQQPRDLERGRHHHAQRHPGSGSSYLHSGQFIAGTLRPSWHHGGGRAGAEAVLPPSAKALSVRHLQRRVNPPPGLPRSVVDAFPGGASAFQR